MREPPALSRTALAIQGSVFADLAPHIEAHTRRGGDLVALHIGDTHLAPPAEARFRRAEGSDEAAFERDLYRYGPIAGLPPLREAFAEHLRAGGQGPPGIDPDRHLLVASGATHAIFCGARAILEAGDEVLVAAPYWPLSVGVLRAAGAVPVEVPLTHRLYADPSLDAATVFEEALTAKTRAIYLITPNNPDGKVLSRAALTRIARLAQARGLWLLADEVYADFVYDGVHTSIAGLEGVAAQTLTVSSLSKSHGLAGARVGFLVGPAPVIDVARRVATHTVFNVPLAAQRVALAALRAPRAWLEDAGRAYELARDETVRALRDAGLAVFPPEGGSYVFVDLSPLLGGRPLQSLLERAIDRGVLVAPGESCGRAFPTWVRICFTSVGPERLREGLARLREAMNDFAR